MKISVGVCTHNGEKFIAQQLNSIINQTIKPDEIIVTDDFSSDNTIRIAEEVLKDSGIAFQVVPYDSHQGILKNFQNCLDKCSGDIIFSCDQDDIWMEDKIESFLPYFKDGCNFVYSNAIVVDTDRNLLEDDFWKCYGINFERLSQAEFQKVSIDGGCIAGCNMAFTKELYDKVRPIPYHFLHDGWLAVCAPLFGKVGFLNKKLIEYRRHGKNTSQFNSDEKISQTKTTEKKVESIYKSTKPDAWFGNHHRYVCAKIFFDRTKDYMDADLKDYVKRYIAFHEHLLKCLPSHSFKSTGILLSQTVKGNYKLFRGNWKHLVRDILYVFINQDKDFTHNTNEW